MKKILAILLTLGMVLSLAACGVTGGSTVEPVSEQTASEAESKTEEPAAIPAEILEKFYPQNCSLPGAVDGRDVHTAYIGLIEDAYIID